MHSCRLMLMKLFSKGLNRTGWIYHITATAVSGEGGGQFVPNSLYFLRTPELNLGRVKNYDQFVPFWMF
jgi:hypothetical protein